MGRAAGLRACLSAPLAAYFGPGPEAVALLARAGGGGAADRELVSPPLATYIVHGPEAVVEGRAACRGACHFAPLAIAEGCAAGRGHGEAASLRLSREGTWRMVTGGRGKRDWRSSSVFWAAQLA